MFASMPPPEPAAPQSPAQTQPNHWALSGARYSVEQHGDTVVLLNGKGHVVYAVRIKGEVQAFGLRKPLDDPFPQLEAKRIKVDGKVYMVKIGPGIMAVYDSAGHPILVLVASPDHSNQMDI